MEQQELINLAMKYMQERGSALIPELQEYMSQYMETAGGWAMEKGPNVILWLGMSHEFVDLLTALLDSKQVYLWPAPALIYHAYGKVPNLPIAQPSCANVGTTGQRCKVPNLPIAQQPPQDGYKDPHWLPCYLKLEPCTVKEYKKAFSWL